MKKTWIAALAAVVLAGLAGAVPSSSTSAVGTQGYVVVLAGTQGADGFAATGTSAAIEAAIATAGGTVANDLSRQIGVLVVHATSTTFASTLAASSLFESVGADFSWQGVTASAPEPVDDPLEAIQWDMQQIRTDEAHDVQGGIPAVDVGVLDTGIDATHLDFQKAGVSSVDCTRGRNSITFVPDGGPGVGTPNPCVDNGFHGTHVAGTIGARANGLGIVGVAPNVTLVPVKVCDASGYCYASAVVDGITYAGDQQFDVINMSFFVDDNEFQQSTEFKCMDDPVQRSFRLAVERAVQYARNRGVTPVAALGNSDEDLAHPSDTENNCEVVPAETQGVIGVSSLGARKEKAGYSNYGTGPNDVAAPGGNGTTGDCTRTILSTFPGDTYFCIQGTSMASPHAAGVAALIVSQYGKLGADGDVKLSPTKVESYLQSSAIDQGLPGYDECFGHGRIDALRAVTHETSSLYDATAPYCPEYEE
ncbi:MAG TPA: S8 family serine peptidase [Gaiellaceae bacterium]|nr:S8 family serine peptidase [Gaiellaceae bacterium]